MGLLSWGFFFSPGIPLLQAALSLGGLESSETHIANINISLRSSTRDGFQCYFIILCATFTPLLFTSGRVEALTPTAAAQQSVSNAEGLPWGFGWRLRLTAGCTVTTHILLDTELKAILSLGHTKTMVDVGQCRVVFEHWTALVFSVFSTPLALVRCCQLRFGLFCMSICLIKIAIVIIKQKK